MEKLTFTNQDEQSFEVSYSKPFYLIELLGLSEIPVSLLSSKGYKQDGETPEGEIYEPRPISFSLSVHGHELEDMYQKRRQVIQYFNPKDSFDVIYENDFISLAFHCRVETAPQFATANTSRNFKTMCTLSLLCDDPYLYDIDENMEILAVITPLLEFPLEIPIGGLEVSTMTNKEVSITNDGDDDTPIVIHFHGPSENPVITNETTGESIIVNQVINDGEVLEINTGYNKKSVIIVKPDGSVTNAFEYIDDATKFWQLKRGKNVLTYSADSGADSAKLYLYYKRKYIGV